MAYSTALPFRRNNNSFLCFYCEETFTEPHDLLVHTKLHSKLDESDMIALLKHTSLYLDVSSLKCSLCQEAIGDIDLLIEHLSQKHAKKLTPIDKDVELFNLEKKNDSCKCLKCDERYVDFSQLYEHMMCHTKTYKCPRCRKQFSDLEDLKIHTKSHEEFVCQVCRKGFRTSLKRTQHAAKEHSRNYVVCLCCTKIFPDAESKSKHMVREHNFPSKTNSRTQVKESSSSTRVDDVDKSKTITSTKVIEISLNTKANDVDKSNHANITVKRSQSFTAAALIKWSNARPFRYARGFFVCFFCRSRFKEVPKILEHTLSHNKPNTAYLIKKILKGRSLVKLEISNLECSICNELQGSIKDLKVHLTSIHGKRFDSVGDGVIPFVLNGTDIFTCQLCAKTFPSFFALNKHENTHFENSICETCGLSFVTDNRLRLHKKLHVPEKATKHTCGNCGKAFQSAHKLQHHVSRTHEKVTRFVCTYCPERFREHYLKLAHMKTVHNKTFTFKCEECQETFSSRRNLRRHTNKIHLNKFKCDFCQRNFSTRAEMSEHAVSHTGEKKYSCQVCGQAYTRSTNLRRHMLIHANK